METGKVRSGLSLIVAVAENGAIGKDNGLLWHLSADLKRFKAAEIAKTEAENLEIVKIIRAMDMSIPELEAFKKRMKNELPGRVEIQKEETRSDDEFREDETEEI